MLKFTGFLGFSLCLGLCQVNAQTQISGRIVDKISKQPIPFVSVALYLQPDSMAVGGTITDSTGRYLLPNLKGGAYKLNTFFVGYKPSSTALTLLRGQRLDLETMTLEGSADLLNEVQVTGQRVDVVMKADRQTYRAAQFQSAAGGTATDVLRNLPGLTINAEGEVSLRGANGFLVLLNGKPVQANLGTLLNQLPANTIESIEVITTPNARFDPDGKAGIIAITTRSGAYNGWSSQANGLIGLLSTNDFGNAHVPSRYGADLTLNYRATKWDITLSSAYIRNDIAGRREGDANTIIGNRFSRFSSVGERSFNRHTLTNRAGISYIPNKQNAWNLGLYQSQRTEDRVADLFYTNSTVNLSTGKTIGQTSYFNPNLVRKNGRFYTTNLDYTHTFLSKATVGGGIFYEYDLIDGFTSNRNLNLADYADTLQYTLSTTNRPIQNFRTAIDASLPLWGGKLETGYQFRYQDDTGDYQYRQQNRSGLPLVLIPAFTGKVAITNRIHSVYAQFGASAKKLDYTVGLRYEYSVRDLVARSQNLAYSLVLNNLFPSFNLLYKPQTGLAVKAGFSRRVQRNSNFALNPLPEREHSETLEQGDPNLLPEFVNLAEVGVSKELGRSTLLATAYFQGVENIINRVNKVYADTILSRIYTNAGLSQRFGLEVAADLKLTQNWKLYAGGTVYRNTLNGQLFQNAVTFSRAAWVYSVNMNTSLQVTPTFSMQASVNYLSQRITAQGEDSRFLTPNLSAKKSLMNNRLTLMAQWQNIGLGMLPTNEQRITTQGADFYTTTNYIQEKDIFLINISYSFHQLSKRPKLPGNEFGDKEF